VKNSQDFGANSQGFGANSRELVEKPWGFGIKSQGFIVRAWGFGRNLWGKWEIWENSNPSSYCVLSDDF
jgi:hypothetical protein